MHIQSIHLHNIGHFKNAEIKFAPLQENLPRVTVFIGNNGSGKTTVLKSLVTALSWLPARIRSERGRGIEIPEEVIHNEATSGTVSVCLHIENQDFSWTLSKAKTGRKNQFSSNLKDTTKLTDMYRTQLTQNEWADLPLIVFYPVERSVIDVPLKIRKKHSFEQLDAYDNALDIGIDFRRFFEWFREREDIENAEKVGYEPDYLNKISSVIDQMGDIYDKLDDLAQELKIAQKDNNHEKIVKISNEFLHETHQFDILKKEQEKLELALEEAALESNKYSDPQLKKTKEAIYSFTGFAEIKIQRKPKLRMLITKENKELNVFQLSQGEKSLMALVGDIARRLVMLNPALDNPLEGKGIVIIDEADLHLHPQWQRQFIDSLIKTFPNCQFVLSTHSPLIISDTKDIVVYSLENGEVELVPSQYGQDANAVLLNIMDTAIRNQTITDKLRNLLDLIQDNQLENAHKKLVELRKILPENNVELIKAEFFLKKQELRNAKNQ